MSFVEFYSSEQLQSVLRPTLSQQLDQAIEDHNWLLASKILAAFIDTWAIGGSIQYAWQHWTSDCDPTALAVLSRANDIIRIIGGSPLRIPVPRALPPYLELEGHEIIDRRAEICAKALTGEIWGVLLHSPVPLLPQAQLALGELRMEAKAQQALERLGLVGLLAPSAPLWQDCFGRAPSGRQGERLRLMCDLAILPSTPGRLAKGELKPTAWLLWNGPAHALPVHRIAYDILHNIDKGTEHAINTAGLSMEQGEEVISELLAIGALDCIS